MPMFVPSDQEKAAVWQAYQDRKATRVPLRWNVNPRIILLNSDLNTEGYTFEEYFYDPKITLTVQARFFEYVATTLSAVCDSPAALPESWNFYMDNQNVYDAAYFGGKVVFREGQCPAAHADFGEADVDAFIAEDYSRPLENAWLRQRMDYHAALVKETETFTHLGRKGKVAPFDMGFDGPVTVATNLFGDAIFMMLAIDPEKTRALLEAIVRACVTRTYALRERNGDPQKSEMGGMADDSIQLISSAMYEEHVMPIHEMWYAATSTATPESGKRSIHLCGDATRHFPMIHERLGVCSFDTGFPVDHGEMRRKLGPNVEISGGPHVGTLLSASPEECAAVARAILESGVKEGGRFVLQEGNNLPPCVPIENLRAVYETCLEYGCYWRI
jgi:uroporphyrinogen-III decarboxylase